MPGRPSVANVILPAILVFLLPAVLSLTAAGFPDAWQPHLWIAWPIAATLALTFVAQQYARSLRHRRSADVQETGDLESLPGSIWNIYAPTMTFAAREADLEQMRHSLNIARRPVALFGRLGAGKSQLARAYGHTFRREFDIGWWVSSLDRPRVVTGLAQLAFQLGLGDTRQELAATRAVEALASRERWLIIFDDATEARDLDGLVPTGPGDVVITSRNPGFTAIAKSLQVKPFEIDLAASYLVDQSGDLDTAAAQRLATALDGLPLALEQAASYCKEVGLSLADYHRRFLDSPEQVLNENGPTDRLPFQRTLELTLLNIGQNNPAALQLLRLLCFYADSAPIPRDLIARDPSLLPRALKRAARKPVGFDAAIATLRRASMIEVEGGKLRIHSLIRWAIRQGIARPSGRARAERMAHRILLRRIDSTATWSERRWHRVALATVSEAAASLDAANPQTWFTWDVLLPHALAVLESGLHSDTLPGAELRGTVAKYLWRRGNLADAAEMYRIASIVYERMEGRRDRRTLGSLASRAIILTLAGDFVEAEAITKDLLGRRSIGRRRNLENLAARANLGILLVVKGRLDLAEATLREVVTESSHLFGASHQRTLAHRHNLAFALAKRGKLAEASGILEDVIAESQRFLGDDHPDTLSSLTNLAYILVRQHRTDQAIGVYGRVLSSSRRVLGEDHPDTVATLADLKQLAPQAPY